MLAILLFACSGDLSNRIFREDAAFAEALPDGDQLALDLPAEVDEVGDEAAELYALTVATLAGGQQVLDGVTDLTDEVLATPPTERGDDYRVWGPVPSDDDPDLFLRVEMSRSSTGSTYTYALQVAETSAGPWWELLSGTHLAGSEDVALGTGSIELVDLASGDRIQVEYDLRALRTVSMERVDGDDAGLGWTWTERADGGGGLSYAQPADTFGSLSTVGATDLQVDSAWLPDGAGRGVARLSGGAYAGSDVELVQCWDRAGTVTWSWDSAGYTETVGDESACSL
ncbi:MAG: hypothetical protein D6798_10570 [Deltaproteobacteria bacterium]|nr:MAG: hypothetical protein D6798_10570 [Deltaproteobacteria bacterium]